jgi:hypothetical protein
MKKLFTKNRLSSLSPAAAQSSHRAQLAWSLCVAIVVAIVALQQAMGSRRVQQHREVATQTNAPHTLMTSKPIPLSQDDLNAPEIHLQ